MVGWRTDNWGVKVVIQRVSRASLRSEAGSVETGSGLLLLVAMEMGDNLARAERAAKRLANLRVFEDDGGRMNLSLLQTGGEALVVPNFTIAANTEKGNRPGFDRAMPPGESRPLFQQFVKLLEAGGAKVKSGFFGERMEVELVNDGPVTLVMEF